MKKVFAALIFVIMLLLSAIILLLKYNLKSDVADDKLIHFEQTIHYTECLLYKGDINDEVILDGIVTGEEYIKTTEYSFDNSQKLLVGTDTFIPEGTSVFNIDGKEIQFDKSIRVIDYTVEEQYIILTYLDYSALFIQAYYDASLEEYVTHQTKVTAQKNDDSLIDVSIAKLGYEIQNGMIEVQLHTSECLLPGTEVKVHLIFHTYTDQWLIPNDWLKTDERGTYVTYLDEVGMEEDVYVNVICRGVNETAIEINEEFTNRRFVYGNH